MQVREHRGAPGAFVVLILTEFLSAPAHAEDPAVPAISWRCDYASALEEAKSRDQLLWIQFTGPWCPNCTRMEQDSFPHPSIREHAQRSYVALKLRSDTNEELALSFNLTGLPATVIVSPAREVLAVRQGYLGPGDLAELLRNALERRQARRDSDRQLALGKTSGGDSSASANGRGAEGKSEHTAIKTETEAALSGYCPVSLVADRRLIQGQVEYTVTHEGRLYRFANMLTFNLFRRDPERYVPVNNGDCPVTQVDRGIRQPGNPKFGMLYEGRLYLCASDADRKHFFEQPARYASVDVVEQGNCPHCLAQEGIRVPGDPKYDLSREGRRYWFPDPSHREAFLAAIEASAARR
jgi:YHS domain-containing protein